MEIAFLIARGCDSLGQNDVDSIQITWIVCSKTAGKMADKSKQKINKYIKGIRDRKMSYFSILVNR